MGARPCDIATILRVTLGALAGCAESPEVPFPGGPEADAGTPSFADTVIAFSSGGQVTSCVSMLAACGSAPPPCAANAVLGPNDGTAFGLGSAGAVEVAFRCGVIAERGAMTDELKIWSTVPAGHEAVVEVSFEGDSYHVLGVLSESNQSFDLSRVPLQMIRYVRIADRGMGGIGIDAVEALR